MLRFEFLVIAQALKLKSNILEKGAVRKQKVGCDHDIMHHYFDVAFLHSLFTPHFLFTIFAISFFRFAMRTRTTGEGHLTAIMICDRCRKIRILPRDISHFQQALDFLSQFERIPKQATEHNR